MSRCLIIGPHIHRCTHTSPYAVSRQEIKVFRFCYLPTSNTPGPSVTPSVRNQKGDGDGRCRMPMGAARSCNATPMRCQIIRTSIQIRVFFFLGSSAAAGRTKERSVSSSRSAYFFFCFGFGWPGRPGETMITARCCCCSLSLAVCSLICLTRHCHMLLLSYPHRGLAGWLMRSLFFLDEEWIEGKNKSFKQLLLFFLEEKWLFTNGFYFFLQYFVSMNHIYNSLNSWRKAASNYILNSLMKLFNCRCQIQIQLIIALGAVWAGLEVLRRQAALFDSKVWSIFLL